MKKITFLILAVILVIVTFYFSLPFLISHTQISSILKQQVKTLSGRDVDYGSLRLAVFPKISVELRDLVLPDIEYDIPRDTEVHTIRCSVQAEQIQVVIRLWALLMRKIDIDSIVFDGVSLAGSSMRVEQTLNGLQRVVQEVPFSLKRISGKLSDVRFSAPMKYTIRIDMEGAGSVLKSSGTVTVPAGNSHEITYDTKTILQNVTGQYVKPLLDYAKSSLGLESGIFNGTVRVSRNESLIAVDLSMTADDLVYYYNTSEKNMKSAPFDYSGNGRISISLSDENIHIDELNVTVAGSKVRVIGDWQYSGDKQYGLTIYSDATKLDSLPLIIPALNTVLPLQFGFAGDIAYDIYLKRTTSAYALRGSIDLRNATLSFAQYVTKPNDFPMSVTMQCSSLDGVHYKGDMTLLLDDLNLKATVAEYDYQSKQVEASFLSNNFNIKKYDQLLPFLRGKKPIGTMKLFGSCEMNMKTVADAVVSGGCAMRDGGMFLSDTCSLSALNANIKFTENAMVVDDLRLKMNESLLEGSAHVELRPVLKYDVLLSADTVDLSFLNSLLIKDAELQTFPKKQKVVQRAQSDQKALVQQPKTDILSSFVAGLGDAATYVPGNIKKYIQTSGNRIALSFEHLVFLNESFDKVYCLIGNKGARLLIPDLRFSLAGGDVACSATVDNPDLVRYDIGAYDMYMVMDDVQIQNFTGYGTRLQTYVDGTIDAMFHCTGQGISSDSFLKNLKGSGTVTVSDGKLLKIDFLDVLSRVGSFLGLKEVSQGITEFDTAEYIFTLGDKTVASRHIKLYSPLYDIDGLGDITFDGNINYRMSVILNEDLSKSFLPDVSGNRRYAVPVQIYNTVAEPKFSVEKALVKDVVNAVVNKGLQAIFGSEYMYQGKNVQSLSEVVKDDERSLPIT